MGSDRERVLERLRQGPVHSTELRRSGTTGNPSQRVRELRDRGYAIEATSSPWKDAAGKRRPGTTYTLTSSEPAPGLASDPETATSDPDSLGVVSVAGEPESGTLFELPTPSPYDAEAAA